MLLVSDDSGDEFGFEVPDGDPDAIDQAATCFQALAASLRLQRRLITLTATSTVEAGEWKGHAARRFADRAGHLGSVFESNATACEDATHALRALSRALSDAQRETTRALSACQTAFASQQNEQRIAYDAADQATTARRQAGTATHPSDVARYNAAADQADRQCSSAQTAAARAGDELTTAQRQGQHAVETYRHLAAHAATGLHQAEADFKPAPDGADSVLRSIASAVAPILAIGKFASERMSDVVDSADDILETQITNVSEATMRQIDAYLAHIASDQSGSLDDSIVGSAGKLDADASISAGDLDDMISTQKFLDSPFAKVLSKGLTDDGALSDVPVVGAVFATADAGVGLASGENPVKAIGEPVTALAAGVVAGEETTALLAAAGVTAPIPVVGEVVLTGLAAGIAVDYVWNHSTQIEHFFAHNISHAVADGKRVVHDLEPWNW